MSTTSGAPRMPPIWQQQAFALDAKYNALRAANSSLGLLYIRRRSQLLREKDSRNSEIRSRYLKIRGDLLRLRYGDIAEAPSSLSSRLSINSGATASDVNSAGRLPENNSRTTAESFAFAGVHHVFEHHKASISALKFANNDRSKLCCASLDGTISICDTTSEPPKVMALLEGHKKGVTGIDWSISNDLIVSSSLDATIRLWRVQAEGQTAPICLRVVGNRMHCEVLCCAFVPANNNFVVVGTSKGLLLMLNVSTGMYTTGGSCTIGGKVSCLACEESGGSLMWAGNDRGSIVSLRLDPGTGSLVKLNRMNGPGGAVTSLCWRPWLSKEAPWPSLLVNSACNQVSLYKVVPRLGGLSLWRQYPVNHRQYAIRSTFCAQLGACLIATGSEDCTVHLLDSAREGRAAKVNRLHGHSAPTLALAFNYDESYLATADHAGFVIIWRNQQRNS